MANKTLQKAIAAAFALALPLGASADPNLENYNLVDSLSSLKTDISTSDGTGYMTLGDATGTTAYDTGNNKQQSLYYCTDPEEFTDKIAFQGVYSSSSLKGWWLRPSNGLYSASATRGAALINLKEGDLVQIVCSQTASNVITLTNADGAADGDFTYELSDDGYSYYITMTADGQVGFCGAKSMGYITDIYYYELDESAVTVDYTVKYVNEDGDSIQADRIGTGVVGDTFTLLDMDKDAIYVGDSIKYVYSSDDAGDGIVLTAEGATITVTFTEAATYSYTVTAVDENSNTLETITSGTTFADEEVTVYCKEYIAVDGVLYTAGKVSSDSKGYYTTVTVSEDNYAETITYSASDITNVVYLIEGEDIEGATVVNTGNTLVRSSQGASAYTDTDITLCSLEAGDYIVNVVVYDINSSASYVDTLDMFSVGGETLTFITSQVNYEALSSDTITLSDASDFVFLAGGTKSNAALDYVYIVSLSDSTDGISEVSAEIESGDAVSAPVYSLSGVKVREAGEGVSGLGKGVYIMNGKKFMVIK